MFFDLVVEILPAFSRIGDRIGEKLWFELRKAQLQPHPAFKTGLSEEQVPATGRLAKAEVTGSGTEFGEAGRNPLHCCLGLALWETSLGAIRLVDHVTAEQNHPCGVRATPRHARLLALEDRDGGSDFGRT